MQSNRASVLKPKQIGRNSMGDVGCAVLSNTGHVYAGVCIDTFGGMGFCAEQSAIGAMVTAGKYKIETIVAVWRNPEGTLFVGAPCGCCREFMRQIDEHNLDTTVVLGYPLSFPKCDKGGRQQGQPSACGVKQESALVTAEISVWLFVVWIVRFMVAGILKPRRRNFPIMIHNGFIANCSLHPVIVCRKGLADF